jgi:hypothetical protein
MLGIPEFGGLDGVGVHRAVIVFVLLEMIGRPGHTFSVENTRNGVGLGKL